MNIRKWILLFAYAITFNSCAAQNNSDSSNSIILPCMEVQNPKNPCFKTLFAEACRCNIENIFVESGIDSIVDYEKLDKLFDFLIKHPQLNISLGSYYYESRNMFRIGNAKSRMVQSYLMSKGISDARLRIRGFDILKDQIPEAEKFKLRVLEILILPIPVVRDVPK